MTPAAESAASAARAWNMHNPADAAQVRAYRRSLAASLLILTALIAAVVLAAPRLQEMIHMAGAG